EPLASSKSVKLTGCNSTVCSANLSAGWLTLCADNIEYESRQQAIRELQTTSLRNFISPLADSSPKHASTLGSEGQQSRNAFSFHCILLMSLKLIFAGRSNNISSR